MRWSFLVERGRPWSCGWGGGDEGGGLVCGSIEPGHGLERPIAVLELPLVIGLEQHGADEPDDAVLVREGC